MSRPVGKNKYFWGSLSQKYKAENQMSYFSGLQWLPMWSGICGQIDIWVILMYDPDSLPWLHDRHLWGWATYCATLLTSSWHSFSFQGQCLVLVSTSNSKMSGSIRAGCRNNRSYPTLHLTCVRFQSHMCPVPGLPHPWFQGAELLLLDNTTLTYLWLLSVVNVGQE